MDIVALRKELDEIDEKLVILLAQRFAVTHDVGIYKKSRALPAIDEAREKLQFDRISKLAEAHGLDEEFAKNMLRLIIDRVVVDHERIITAV